MKQFKFGKVRHFVFFRTKLTELTGSNVERANNEQFKVIRLNLFWAFKKLYYYFVTSVIFVHLIWASNDIPLYLEHKNIHFSMTYCGSIKMSDSGLVLSLT